MRSHALKVSLNYPLRKFNLNSTRKKLNTINKLLITSRHKQARRITRREIKRVYEVYSEVESIAVTIQTTPTLHVTEPDSYAGLYELKLGVPPAREQTHLLQKCFSYQPLMHHLVSLSGNSPCERCGFLRVREPQLHAASWTCISEVALLACTFTR